RPRVRVAEAAAAFVQQVGLLMTDQVRLSSVRIFQESHKGLRGQPAATATGRPVRMVELSHLVTAGMLTYPGLPGPEITQHLTREESRSHYAPGTEFEIGRISMVGNTGTYLDSPYHRYPDGADLAGLPLDALADLPAAVVGLTGRGGAAI